LQDISAEKIASALRRLLADPNASAAIGKYNAQVAWATFEAKAVTAEIESFYSRVASC
jgi:glycosyltransferase involved in cell wall biosynthesis